ncbi:MAG: ABC transporter substrate-binding protein [Aerococcus sp.]|nr:ABC transporter substrate-binding protein [Aerococcus sp.]
MRGKGTRLGLVITLIALMIIGFSRWPKQHNDQVQVGIVQLVEQEPLDKVRAGFIDQLKQNGYEEGKNLKIRYRNANADQSNVTSIAQQFIGRNDLNFAITTVSAQAMLAADRDTPLIFSPITDPIQAKLATNWQHPDKNATGTSDQVPLDQLLDHFQAAFPQMKRVGMIYNASEVNSKQQFTRLQQEGKKRGIMIVGQTITTTNDVASAIQTLIAKVDGIVLPTDNYITSAIPVIASAVKEANIPVMGSDEAQLAACVATYGVDYYSLGQQAGEMASQILKGEKKAQDLPIQTAKQFHLELNPDIAQALHVTKADFQ